VAPYVYVFPWRLDEAAMEQAAAAFVGEHDFTSFAASDPDRTARLAEAAGEDGEAPTAVRRIFSSSWTKAAADHGELLVYRVRGTGFLHHMVRNLVGTMLDVGRGHIAASDIPAILEARNRREAGPTSPARGLFLDSVEYGGADESEQ
jgi:tRNA pseudouridine38-40 synthase